MASLERAREAKTALQRALAGRDGVTGIGLTRTPGVAGALDAGGDAGAPEATSAEEPEQPDDTWCVQVNVVDADARHDVPQEIDSVAVVVRVTGRIARSGQGL